jgi:hypothetical protein
MGREASTERIRQYLRLGTTLPRASVASFIGSVSPATRASSIARPETPSTSVTTVPSFILALEQFVDAIGGLDASSKSSFFDAGGGRRARESTSGGLSLRGSAHARASRRATRRLSRPSYDRARP